MPYLCRQITSSLQARSRSHSSVCVSAARLSPWDTAGTQQRSVGYLIWEQMYSSFEELSSVYRLHEVKVFLIW